MRLQKKLTLAMLLVVAVMGVAGWIAIQLNRGIQLRVSQLSQTQPLELGEEVLVGRTFSIEGEVKGGRFVADSLEELPWSRRPKLRGALESVDPSGRTLTLFGQRIQWSEETEFAPIATNPLEEAWTLTPGMRIEVSCRVDEEGHWHARKLTRNVKPSDKIKGTVTAEVQASTRLLSIDGLEVETPAQASLSRPQGPLRGLALAEQMTLAVQACLAAGQELLKEGFRVAEDERTATRKEREEGARARFWESYEAFARNLEASRRHVEDLDQAGAAPERLVMDLRDSLTPLEDHRIRFVALATEFLERCETDVHLAEQQLREDLAPFLQTRVLPLVHIYALHTEEALALELASIARDSEKAGSWAIRASAVGLGLALLVGLLVSRSIAFPILSLAKAAEAIGAGQLETRVPVTSADEIGTLASAFNHMAERVDSSTLSVSNLNNVIDSMAGALFLLDQEGRITSVNPAAHKLLQYREGDLLGKLFEEISYVDAEDENRLGDERFLLRLDGERIPISFSCAPLRPTAELASGTVCLAQDLTQRRELESKLRVSLGEKELLLREVHHRVKNNLQVVSSLLDLQSRSVSDELALEKFQESQDRIRSMVFIHDQLYQSQDLTEIDLRPYLETITLNLSQAYLALPETIRVQVEVEDMRLELDQALSCGMIVNELVTNSIKHAFAKGELGEIRVRCQATKGGGVLLEVTDSGRGFENVEGASPDSLGLSLVRTFVTQLKGKLRFDGKRGAAYRIEFAESLTREVA